MTASLEFVTYCGLYCGLCADRTRIPQRAAALQAAMVEEGWPYYGPTMPGFEEFWRFLQELTEGGCPGCRAGGGPPNCLIRVCARQRGSSASGGPGAVAGGAGGTGAAGRGLCRHPLCSRRCGADGGVR